MVMLLNEPAGLRLTEASEIERRRGLRVRQTRPVKVFEPSLARYFAGHTEDVSATGLRIDLPVGTPIQPGRTITIHVGSGAAGESLVRRRSMIPARVVWIDRSQAGERRGRMTCGVELVSSIAASRDAA